MVRRDLVKQPSTVWLPKKQQLDLQLINSWNPKVMEDLEADFLSGFCHLGDL